MGTQITLGPWDACALYPRWEAAEEIVTNRELKFLSKEKGSDTCHFISHLVSYTIHCEISFYYSIKLFHYTTYIIQST